LKVLEELGFRKVLEFKTMPCEVWFHPDRSLTLSLGELQNFYWVKASKHMYIKAMGKKGESSIYSRLQEITKFMGYLKHNLPEFHCVTYYISDITPRIALRSSKSLSELERDMARYKELEGLMGKEPVDEERLIRLIELLGPRARKVKMLKEGLLERKRLRQELKSRLEMADRALSQ
jgi:hypothetical protein